MNKSEMVDRVAGERQVTRDAAEAAVGAVFSVACPRLVVQRLS